MKAIILAAGHGSRLLPLTLSTPKCLVQVGGRAILDSQLDAVAAAALERHDWPGNVRELRQVLDRALAFAEGGPIRLEHLPRAIAESERYGRPCHS